MKNLVAAVIALATASSTTSTHVVLAFVPRTLLTVQGRTTTTRMMASSSSSSSDNNAMSFLKKIGRVGGDANIDFVDAVGSDEGSIEPPTPTPSDSNSNTLLTSTTTTTTTMTSSTTPPPRNMLCPPLSLEHPLQDSGNELAVVACGWFWHPQPAYLGLRGVVRCEVGYTGGKVLSSADMIASPVTYRSIQDYTEALLIEFDPTVISYEQVLAQWKSDASPYPTSTQYRTAVWYVNAAQQTRATAFVQNMSGKEHVGVEPTTQFFRAEEYHQNFLQKQTSRY